jgi:adenylyltransferase/sulfurtransferase
VQAAEAIKLITGVGETLAGRLLLVDAARMHFRTVALRRDPACPACGTREIRDLAAADALCAPTPAAGASGALDEVRDVTPRELAGRLARGDALELIDVREPYEHRLARIADARLIPLRSIEQAIPSLDRDREVVLICHHGVRSMAAAELLQARGFTRVWNLAGGIDRWSDEVDPSVPRY